MNRDVTGLNINLNSKLNSNNNGNTTGIVNTSSTVANYTTINGVNTSTNNNNTDQKNL